MRFGGCVAARSWCMRVSGASSPRAGGIGCGTSGWRQGSRSLRSAVSQRRRPSHPGRSRLTIRSSGLARVSCHCVFTPRPHKPLSSGVRLAKAQVRGVAAKVVNGKSSAVGATRVVWGKSRDRHCSRRSSEAKCVMFVAGRASWARDGWQGQARRTARLASARHMPTAQAVGGSWHRSLAACHRRHLRRVAGGIVQCVASPSQAIVLAVVEQKPNYSLKRTVRVKFSNKINHRGRTAA